MGDAPVTSTCRHHGQSSRGGVATQLSHRSTISLSWMQILRLEGGEAGITAEVPGLMKEYDRDL